MYQSTIEKLFYFQYNAANIVWKGFKMATQVGVIKQVSGTVVAVDANGKERILTAGDAIFFGEIVKTIGNNSNAVIAMDGGKDVSILANDTVLIDQNILNIIY